MKNIHIAVLLMLVLQSMICTAQESKSPENEAYRMQEIPSLQNIIARDILIDFNNKIDQDTPLSQDDRDGWIDYLTNHQILFKDVINDDICSQDNQTVIKKGDLLFKAVTNNNAEIIQLLIAVGADINIQNNHGYTSLHYAVWPNNEKIARMLIDARANVNIQDKNGCTPLHQAAAKNSVETARMLIDAGADINLQDKNGSTPLDFAVWINNRVKIACMLIDAGADLNIQDKFGKTTLHNVVLSDNVEIVRMLIDAGVDLNSKDHHGYTSLHYAVWDDRTKIAQMLIDAGADPTIQDNQGRTPEQIARTLYMRLIFYANRNINSCTIS